MIISVNEIREQYDIEWTDQKIIRKIKAIEQAIRQYCNNNFQNYKIRCVSDIKDGKLQSIPIGLKNNDTFQISYSMINDGVYTLSDVLDDEKNVLVTKVDYPADVIDCAFNIFDWEVNNRDKVGIASESISRHTVTYFNNDGENTVSGYPASLFGALKKYRKIWC